MDEKIRDDEKDKEDKGEEADRPGEPDFGKKGFEREWKDDAAKGTARRCYPGGLTPSAGEEVGNCTDGRGEYQRSANAAENGKGEDEMPEF